MNRRSFVTRVFFTASFLAVGFFAISQARSAPEEQIAYFSHALKQGLVSETVVMRDKTYTVTDGVARHGDDVLSREATAAVMRLVYAKTVARRSPLLATPGVLPHDLREAATLLEQTVEQLAAAQGNTQDSSVIRDALYPLPFLYALADAEEARLSFIGSGSDTARSAYEQAQRKALSEYKASLDRFEKAFRKVVPSDIRNYAVRTKIISRNGTLGAIETLRQGAAATEAALAERSACLRGHLKSCDPKNLRLPTLSYAKYTPLSDTQRALTSHILSAIERVPYQLDSALGRRLVQLTYSHCTAADKEGAPLFALRHISNPIAAEHLKVVYVGNWDFLHVTPGSSYAQLPYLENFVRDGIQYVTSHPITYYECPYADADQGAIFAVRAIALLAQENPLSQYATAGTAQHLRALEEHLTTKDIITESDAAHYLSEAINMLRDPATPGTVKSLISTHTLQLAYRSQGLYHTLFDIALAEQSNLRLIDKGARIDVSPLNLFYTRNALPGLYAAANPSITGAVSPLFADNTLPKEEQPYAAYSSFWKEPGAQQTLLQSLRYYHDNYEMPQL